jgi:hypothetical protein
VIEYPGRRERALAATLMSSLPESAASALTWAGVDLRSSAEHLPYVALRQPSLSDVRRPLAATAADWLRSFVERGRPPHRNASEGPLESAVNGHP